MCYAVHVLIYVHNIFFFVFQLFMTLIACHTIHGIVYRWLPKPNKILTQLPMALSFCLHKFLIDVHPWMSKFGKLIWQKGITFGFFIVSHLCLTITMNWEFILKCSLSEILFSHFLLFRGQISGTINVYFRKFCKYFFQLKVDFCIFFIFRFLYFFRPFWATRSLTGLKNFKFFNPFSIWGDRIGSSHISNKKISYNRIMDLIE